MAAVAAIATVSAIVVQPQVVEQRDEVEPVAPLNVEITAEDTTATATWAGGTGAGYRVEYSTRFDFSSADTATAEQRQLGLESLVPGTTYFLRVAAVQGDEVSQPSRLVRFKTEFTHPAPRLVVGSTSTTSLAPRWASKADDVSFEVQLDRDREFEDPRSKVVAKRKASFGKLKYSAKYFVRVRIVDDEGVALSPWSDVEARRTSREAPLRVGTFNVLKSANANWSARRGPVAETIRSQDLDVVGLQEATPATVAGGVRQFQDVLRVLGPEWALTDTSTGPTGETRTVYNTERLDLVEHGYQEIPGSTRFGVMRYITWAIFEQKATQKQFVFLNTHFITSKARSRFGPRAAAAGQMAALAKSISKDEMPVVIAGDFNSADFRDAGNGVYRAITGAGYVDPLVQSDQLGSAEQRINADLKTVNKLARVPRRDAWAPMIDHMFVSPMRVEEWETVANLDGSGRVIGTIPSDHHLIRLTVHLP